MIETVFAVFEPHFIVLFIQKPVHLNMGFWSLLDTGNTLGLFSSSPSSVFLDGPLHPVPVASHPGVHGRDQGVTGRGAETDNADLIW